MITTTIAPQTDYVVRLKGGVTVHETALALALDLERRGITLTARQGALDLSPKRALTDEDREAVQRWKQHLLAIAGYEPPAI